MDEQQLCAALHRVLDERIERSGIPQEEHYLHHIWLRNKIGSDKDVRALIRNAVLGFGVLTVLGFVVWAVWEGIKIKLGWGGP
ncbi:MAG TPA: hypothetical protein VNK91_01975 [Burkholderiaceae bacterium]|nr:hypothetical protein [Burkholderiaceae bacterium]